MTHPISQANYVNTLILTMCLDYNERSCLRARENNEEEKGRKRIKTRTRPYKNKIL